MAGKEETLLQPNTKHLSVVSFILSKIYSKKPICMPDGPLVKWRMCWQQCRLHFVTVTSHGRTFLWARVTRGSSNLECYFSHFVSITRRHTTSSFDDKRTHFFRIKISGFHLIVASSSQLCVCRSGPNKKMCGMKIGSLICFRPFHMHYIDKKIESSRRNRIEFRCSAS